MTPPGPRAPGPGRFPLPRWVGGFLAAKGEIFPGPRERVGLAVDLARENVRRGTGGPFGSAVFTAAEGRLVAGGVNLVVPARCSIAHAEVVALDGAQAVFGTHDLGGTELPPLVLAASTDPCLMCLGALVWSGVGGLECGARQEDAQAMGFDEGPKPPGWEKELAARGIAVERGLLGEEAAAVLREYAAGGGMIYNPTRDGRGRSRDRDGRGRSCKVAK